LPFTRAGFARMVAQWGEVDVWSSPLVTFNTGAGDCEDYAIAKYVALQMTGISAEDLRIVVVLDLDRNGEAKRNSYAAIGVKQSPTK
jgi:predicted transglutaminase-like cysteine proteinase